MGSSASGGRRHGKTRQQHERAGTYRADRHADLISPNPPTARPTPPVSFEGEELAEWERMMVRLELSQSLFQVHDATIIQYCRLHAELLELKREQDETKAGVKILQENLNGIAPEEKAQVFGEIVALYKLISRATDQLRQGRMAIRQYLVEFGLTPASMSRIKLPAPPAAAEDEFTSFQRKRLA